MFNWVLCLNKKKLKLYFFDNVEVDKFHPQIYAILSNLKRSSDGITIQSQTYEKIF